MRPRTAGSTPCSVPSAARFRARALSSPGPTEGRGGRGEEQQRGGRLEGGEDGGAVGGAGEFGDHRGVVVRHGDTEVDDGGVTRRVSTPTMPRVSQGLAAEGPMLAVVVELGQLGDRRGRGLDTGGRGHRHGNARATDRGAEATGSTGRVAAGAPTTGSRTITAVTMKAMVSSAKTGVRGVRTTSGPRRAPAGRARGRSATGRARHVGDDGGRWRTPRSRW